MFDPFWGAQSDILQQLGNIMVFSFDELLAISLTINMCTLTYCVTLQLQKYFTSKCCCKKSSIFIVICHVYESKPSMLSKMVTELLAIWILFVLCLPALFASGVMKHPFSGYLVPSFETYVRILLAISIGKYIYLIAQNSLLLQKTDLSKWRTETIHHVVTIVCYGIFLAYHQNLLLSLIGMTMEISSTSVYFTKILKEIGKNSEKIYREMSIFSCILTVGSRGVIPVIFLVIAMCHETPFVMEHAVLTVFFLTIIFFSVINVWLILSSVQRLVKSFCVNFDLCHNFDGGHEQRDIVQSRLPRDSLQTFTKNNLGYLRRYENKNLCNNSNEKLNTCKKNPVKQDFSSSLVHQDDSGAPIQVLRELIIPIDEESRGNPQSSHSQRNSEQTSLPPQERVLNDLRDSTDSDASLIRVNDVTQTYVTS